MRCELKQLRRGLVVLMRFCDASEASALLRGLRRLASDGGDYPHRHLLEAADKIDGRMSARYQDKSAYTLSSVLFASEAGGLIASLLAVCVLPVGGDRRGDCGFLTESDLDEVPPNPDFARAVLECAASAVEACEEARTR